MISMSLLDVHRGGRADREIRSRCSSRRSYFLYDEALHGPGGSCEEVLKKRCGVLLKDDVSGLAVSDR